MSNVDGWMEDGRFTVTMAHADHPIWAGWVIYAVTSGFCRQN